MPEATHLDIINRIARVEQKAIDMALDLAVVKNETARTVKGVENNKAHFDVSVNKLITQQESTTVALQVHQAEIRTGIRVLLTAFGLGISALGVLVALQ